MDPAAFDDHEWINSPDTVDGTNVLALVGEEYQGRRAGYGNNCTGEWAQLHKCWRNSITLATPTNGGKQARQAEAEALQQVAEDRQARAETR